MPKCLQCRLVFCRSNDTPTTEIYTLCPRALLLLEHVLQVRGLLELLIVVDRELAGCRLDEESAVARAGENRLGVAEHRERAEAAVFDEVHPTRETDDVRVIPRNGKDDRCIEQHAKV